MNKIMRCRIQKHVRKQTRMRNLAKKIKDLRQIIAITQPEFAKAVGDVDQSTVSKWEQGKQKPRPEHILKMAQMANVTPEQFMGIPMPGKTEGEPPPTVRVTGALLLVPGRSPVSGRLMTSTRFLRRFRRSG